MCIVNWCNANQGFLTAVLTIITIIVAIGVPARIAQKQNKIALFEKRLSVYLEFVDFTDLRSLDFEKNTYYYEFMLGDEDAIAIIRNKQQILSQKIEMLFSQEISEPAAHVITWLYSHIERCDIQKYNKLRENVIIDFQKELSLYRR